MILVYTTPGCSRCAVAKELLAQRGDPFEERDYTSVSIEEKTIAANAAAEGGINSFPIILRDGRAISMEELA